MINFEEWYAINPWKDKLDELNLTEKEKKKLTPVLISSTFLLEIKPFYDEFGKKYKRLVSQQFIMRMFPLNYKKRLLSVVPFYSLEYDLKYLISKVPEAVKINVSTTNIEKYKDLLATGEFFETTLEKGFDERSAIIHDGKVLGYRYKEERP